jgi:hypothetical protein
MSSHCRTRQILLRLVGSLALGAIASGAFSTFLLRGTRGVTLDDVARISSDQLAELARFVAQVNPDSPQQLRSCFRCWRSGLPRRIPNSASPRLSCVQHRHTAGPPQGI